VFLLCGRGRVAKAAGRNPAFSLREQRWFKSIRAHQQFFELCRSSQVERRLPAKQLRREFDSLLRLHVCLWRNAYATVLETVAFGIGSSNLSRHTNYFLGGLAEPGKAMVPKTIQCRRTRHTRVQILHPPREFTSKIMVDSHPGLHVLLPVCKRNTSATHLSAYHHLRGAL
jgi:hypothetical protein